MLDSCLLDINTKYAIRAWLMNFIHGDCIWRFSDGHYARADIAKNKGSIKFDIWKGKE